MTLLLDPQQRSTRPAWHVFFSHALRYVLAPLLFVSSHTLPLSDATAAISAKLLPVLLAPGASVMAEMTEPPAAGLLAAPPALPATVLPFSVFAGWSGWVTV